MRAQGWWESAVKELLEQGDIVESAPFAAVPSPVVNLIGTSLKGGAKGWSEYAEPKFEADKSANFLARGPLSYAMVLNHGCDIDKPTNKYLLVVPVKRLSEFPEAHQVVFRQQASIPQLYLPDIPSIGDGVADLRLMTRVPSSVVTSGTRLATMTPFARERVGVQLMMFFTRKEPEDR
jgi:hypothetical protein